MSGTWDSSKPDLYMVLMNERFGPAVLGPLMELYGTDISQRQFYDSVGAGRCVARKAPLALSNQSAILFRWISTTMLILLKSKKI